MKAPLAVAAAVACAAATVAALVAAVRKAGRAPLNQAYEHKFRALKWGRVATYIVLVGCQAALVLGHAAQHWPDELSWGIDGTQALVLLVYAATLGVLAARWRTQLSLQLGGMLLVSLASPALLFWQDITGVRPDGTLDAEHVARVVLHCVQFVLLLGLLVGEVIIQQHQLLQKGCFDALPTSSSNGAAAAAAGGYQPLPGGAAQASKAGQHRQQQQQQQHRRQQQRSRPWRPGDSRWQMTASAFYYVWPQSTSLRLRLLACLLLVLAERVINLAAPIAFKNMVEVLSGTAAAAAAGGGGGSSSEFSSALNGTALLQTQPGQQQQQPGQLAALVAGASRRLLDAAGSALGGDGAGLAAAVAPFWVLFYPWVFVYLGAFFLRGGSGSEGLLANLRDILWIPITQAAFRRISADVFGHLLELDLAFHVHRKTGQIMRILDRGTSSIQDTVSIVLFNVLPQLIDIIVACSYLASALRSPWVALIVLLTVGSYVPLTLVITEQRGKVRKVMNALDNEREGRATDMLLNYETIKYFCAEARELGGYDDATREYQAAEYWQMAFLSLLSLVQSLVVWLGLAAGLVVCVAGAARGAVSVGDTVLFVALMQQLYVPLTFFGSYYRQVTKALIDMENMLELLATQPRVRDAPGAPELRVTDGTVEFQQVVFTYSPGLAPPVLRGLSFFAPGGRSLAVVGSTGSGKSTLLRLLLRFYDPQSGAVLIDGQDIARVRQTSVRAAIGVVPQDCVLFNETVLYNIRYGRPAAPDSAVYEAARVSHIHDHLSRFPHGYATRVGERGLRLSGGEKQRVAFARAVLKAPAIMVLDEATSSLDSLTERLIQDSLAAIRGTCTQVIVAHRLSTIMDADAILVLHQGTVAECDSHANLVAAGGLYASMWARQQDSSAQQAPAQAPAAAGDGGGGGSGSKRKTAATAAAAAAGSLTEVSEVADVDEQPGTQQPHQQPNQQQQQQSSSRRPPRSGGVAAPAAGPRSSEEEDQDEDGVLSSRAEQHPGSSAGTTLRCNSSCGHGRHANFWARSVADGGEEEDGDEEQEEAGSAEGGTDAGGGASPNRAEQQQRQQQQQRRGRRGQ